jgi:transcriptional regulator with XRE-family HTH domain
MGDVEMTDKGPRRCRSCQAVARRGYGGLCHRCFYAVDAPPLVPQGFFDTPELRAALETYDFGPVFLAVRSAAGLAQSALCARLHMAQNRVSMIENGKTRIRRIDLVVQIANGLRIPVRLLGYGPGTIDTRTAADVRPVYDPGELFMLVNALAFSPAECVAPDIERLETLMR